MTDERLVERARNGDRGAYEALARASSRRLFVIAHRILRDIDAAEDAVQQTLVAIWKELPRLRDDRKFDAWTYRLVTRAAVREAKRARRGRELATIGPRDTTTGDASERIADRDTLEQAFRRLSPEGRAVVVLRYYLDLPVGEISEVLGIPYGTVGSRLHRALRDLRSAVNVDAVAERPLPAAEADAATLVKGPRP